MKKVNKFSFFFYIVTKTTINIHLKACVGVNKCYFNFLFEIELKKM